MSTDFINRVMHDRNAFSTELAKLFHGPQGPAAAELLASILSSQKSRFCVDLGNLVAIHLRRSHRELVINQLNRTENDE